MWLTLVHVDERIQQIDEVAQVVQCVPHGWSTLVDLPEDRPPHHEDDIVEHRQRNDGQPLQRYIKNRYF